MVKTGFEVAIKRCPRGLEFDFFERFDFSMGVAHAVMIAFRKDTAVFYDDGSDHRIGEGLSFALFSKFETSCHEFGIGTVHGQTKDQRP